MKFELTEEEMNKVEAFAAEQYEIDKKSLEETLAKPENAYMRKYHPPGSKLYGAIGGNLAYIFTPTSIGTVVKVRASNGAELDLTDYSSW